MRTSEWIGDCCPFAPLQDQRILGEIGGVTAEVLKFVFVLFSQVIKAEAVFFCIHDGQQLCLEQLTLGGVQQTFKYGVLHTLPIVDALFGNLAQTSPSGSILCIMSSL